MIKYLIWDFDGVLCDSLSYAIKAHNIIIDSKLVEARFVSGRDSYVNELISMHQSLDSNSIDKYYCEHRNLMFQFRENLKLFFDTISFIKEIAIPSIILTSTYEKLVISVLENNNVDTGLFNEIIGRETPGTKLTKIKKFLSKNKLNTEDVIAIGDSPSDVEFCEQLNILFVGVSYGYHALYSFDNYPSIKICNTQSELIEYLSNLGDYTWSSN